MRLSIGLAQLGPGLSNSQEIPKETIREQLERICRSPVFSYSERTSALLRYVVEEALDGKGE